MRARVKGVGTGRAGDPARGIYESMASRSWAPAEPTPRGLETFWAIS
jgi:hypothetical protein